MLSGRKSKCECRKVSSYNLLHPTELYDEIRSRTISQQSSTFSLHRKFLQMFSNDFHALLSAKFNCVLKSWSLGNCIICGPMKIPSFILASLILGNFCLKLANSSLHLAIALHLLLTNRAWYAVEANRFLAYPLKQDVPHSSDLVLFLQRVAFFYTVVAVPRSAVPFTLKAAEYSVYALQHSQHCY